MDEQNRSEQNGVDELREHVKKLEQQINVLRGMIAVLALGVLAAVFYPSLKPQPQQQPPASQVAVVSGSGGSYRFGYGGYIGPVREVVRTRRLEIYDRKDNKLMVVSGGEETCPTLVMKKDKSLVLFGLKPSGAAYISMSGSGGKKQWISTDGSDPSGVPPVESIWRTPRMQVGAQQPGTPSGR